VQVLQKANVKQLVDIVVGNVEFFELSEGLNTLSLFKLTPSQVQDSYVVERGSDVSETSDNRVI
jgi:hypothetical protein